MFQKLLNIVIMFQKKLNFVIIYWLKNICLIFFPVNLQDRWGFTALMEATEKGSVHIAQQLSKREDNEINLQNHLYIYFQFQNISAKGWFGVSFVFNDCLGLGSKFCVCVGVCK